MFKVLSIDGGGIRGVIPAALLTEIEKRKGARIADLFDLVAGTSTGGIIAAGLVLPGPGGKPKYKAKDLLRLYEDKGRIIFKRSLWDRIADAEGIIDEVYDHKNLVSILKDYMGSTKLSRALKPLIVPAYDIEKREPYFFKSQKAVADPSRRDHQMWVAARATSAAPTYFEPALLNRPQTGDQTRRVLIDGGVFVNNPAMCAYVEALSLGVPPEDIVVVSLGTGVNTRKIPYRDAKGWGKLGWVVPVIDIMMDGSADAVDHHLKSLMPETGKQQRYFRFDTPLDKAKDDLDDASTGNVMALRAEADDILKTQGPAFRRMISLL